MSPCGVLASSSLSILGLGVLFFVMRFGIENVCIIAQTPALPSPTPSPCRTQQQSISINATDALKNEMHSALAAADKAPLAPLVVKRTDLLRQRVLEIKGGWVDVGTPAGAKRHDAEVFAARSKAAKKGFKARAPTPAALPHLFFLRAGEPFREPSLAT